MCEGDMMRVKFKTFGFEREMTLEAALTPHIHAPYIHARGMNGTVEQVNNTSEQMARLLAHLVESKVIELEAAFSIAGVYVEELELVKDDA